MTDATEKSATGATRHPLRLLLSLVTVLALIAAACGGDDDTAATDDPPAADDSAGDGAAADDSAGDDAAADESAGDDAAADESAGDDSGADGAADEPEAKEPVLIVALLDISGPAAVREDAQFVVEATIADINANGGLNGHQIELEVVDTRGDPVAAQAGIDEHSGSNPIAWVMASPGSEAASGEALGATNVPIIGLGFAPNVWGGKLEAFGLSCELNPDWCALPNAFTLGTTFAAVVDEQVLGAQTVGATTLATAACAEVEACSQAAPVFDATAAVLGLTSVGVTKVSSTAADYTSECVGWIQDDVDYIQLSGPGTMAIRVMESCADQGYDGFYGASAGSVSGDLLTAPYPVAGGLNAFPWWVDDAPVAEFREIMTAAGVTERQYSSSTQTGLYSSLRLLQKAVADYADPEAPLDAAAVLAALNSVTDETLDGLIPPVTFSADDLDRAQLCFWPFIKDTDNVFTNPLGGLNFQCYPEQ